MCIGGEHCFSPQSDLARLLGFQLDADLFSPPEVFFVPFQILLGYVFFSSSQLLGFLPRTQIVSFFVVRFRCPSVSSQDWASSSIIVQIRYLATTNLRCNGHLFYLSTRPSFYWLRGLVLFFFDFFYSYLGPVLPLGSSSPG